MRKVLDLFSGIGGFSLGLESTGEFETLAFVEIDSFCQKVLKKHWPHVPVYSDIRNIRIVENDFDVLCGGFPCQDVSLAAVGNQKSILGDRSGLWFEYLRLIREGKPTWVIIENVENLRNKGLAQILEQLAEIGYDAEWHVIPAYVAGLPHVRNRIWILAYLMRNGLQRHSPFPLQTFSRFPWRENGRNAQNFLDGWDIDNSVLLRSRNGIPNYMDRIKSLGNSVVPEIVYYLGLAIIETGL